MEISVSETTPGPSGIKTEPKEEDCEDLLSAFMVEPPPVKIENDDSSENDEYGSLSEDYKVDIKKLKTEQSDDSKEWLKNYRIKSEENDQLAVSGEDQDDDFTEDNNIKSEEMHIKEDDGIDEPGISATQNPEEHSQTRDENMSRCNHCSHETVDKTSLKRHLYMHALSPETMKTFQCSQCEFKTTWMHVLKKHLRLNCDFKNHDSQNAENKQTSAVNVFECQNCSYKTNSQFCFTTHLQQHEQGDFKPISTSNKTTFTIVHRPPKDVLKCYHCSYETVNNTSFKEHLYRHALSPKTMRTFQCSKCEFKTTWMHTLKEHLRLNRDSHPRPRLHQNPDFVKCGCLECNATTKLKRNMVRGLLVHGKSKDATVLKCYHCPYETRRKHHLISHLQRRHRPTLLFQKHPRLKCDTPNLENKQTSTVNVSKSVDKCKFECQNCSYKTNSQFCFTTHLQQHEQGDFKPISTSNRTTSTIVHIRPEDVLKCYHCSYETVDKTSFKGHLYRHALSPQTMRTFQCSKCEFKTTWMHVLKEHLRLNCDFKNHDSQKAENKQKSSPPSLHQNPDFVKCGCLECNATTTPKSNMVRDLLVHRKSKETTMLKCYHCSYETSRRYVLINHLQRWHRKRSESPFTLLFEKHPCLNYDRQNGENKETSAINVSESVDNCKFKFQNCRTYSKKDLQKTVVKTDLQKTVVNNDLQEESR